MFCTSTKRLHRVTLSISESKFKRHSNLRIKSCNKLEKKCSHTVAEKPSSSITVLLLQTWASEGFFPGGGAKSRFFQGVAKNIFPGWGQNWKNFIFPLETKKTALFAKNLIGKCQTSNSRGFKPPVDAHACKRFGYPKENFCGSRL